MKNKNYDTIVLKINKIGPVTEKEFKTWLNAYNEYADYVNEYIDLWNYEHEHYYADFDYPTFYASKTYELRNVLSARTGMTFEVEDCQFIGYTKNGGKIYIA